MTARVIGIGNPDRGDDGVGRAVARRLSEVAPGLDVVEQTGEATALLAAMEGAARVFFIDACVSGVAAGTIRRFDLAEAPLPPLRPSVSSHGFGLAEALQLAAALGQMPARCVVYAIEGADFAHGAPLSAPARAAVEEAVNRLAAELTEGQGGA